MKIFIKKIHDNDDGTCSVDIDYDDELEKIAINWYMNNPKRKELAIQEFVVNSLKEYIYENRDKLEGNKE